MGPNGAAVTPPPQEAQVNLDKIFLDDFRVAFRVGRSRVFLGTVLISFDSTGWKPRERNWIWCPSASPPCFVGPS